MRRSPITAALLLALASSLAACGGGGGGTPSVLPSTQPPTPKSAKVLATFGSSGTTPQGLYKSAVSAPMSTVVGQIIPTQQVVVPDAYLTGGPTTGVEAQAVLDTSDGSAVPSPLPSVTWGQSGNPAPIPTAYPNWPVTACACQQVFNAEVIGTPSTPGQTTISMTSMGATANLTLLAYRGMGLRSSLDTGNIFHALTGAMFDANGISEQADTQADTDISLDASTSPSGVVFQYGAVPVGYNALDTTTGCPAIPAGPVTVSVSTFNGSSPNTYCFKTHDGRIGKWWETAVDDADIFAGYMISANGSFAY